MEKVKWTFLTEEQIWGGFEEPAGDFAPCKATDFAKLLGCYLNSDNGRCVWWSASKTTNDYVRSVYSDGTKNSDYPDERALVARPALPFSELLKISPNGVRGINAKGILTYTSTLEYPKTAVEPGSELEKELNGLEKAKKLQKYGKPIRVDSVPTEYRSENWEKRYTERKLERCMHDGKKYVKMSAFVPDSSDKHYKLDSGTRYTQGKEYWVKVELVTFLILKEKKTGKEVAVIEDGAYSGIQMNHSNNYDGNLDASDGGRYLNECFAEDVMQQSPEGNLEINQLFAELYKGNIDKEILRKKLKELNDRATTLEESAAFESALDAGYAEYNLKIQKDQKELASKKKAVSSKIDGMEF